MKCFCCCCCCKNYSTYLLQTKIDFSKLWICLLHVRLKDGHFLAGGTPLSGLKLLSNNSLWIQSMDNHLAGVYTCARVTAEDTISVNAYIWIANGSKSKESSCGIGELIYL